MPWSKSILSPSWKSLWTVRPRSSGINSRDLDTFTIETEAAWRLLGKVPSATIAVAESGIARQADVVRVARAGADAVLVGTALSGSPAPEKLLRELSRGPTT